MLRLSGRGTVFSLSSTTPPRAGPLRFPFVIALVGWRGRAHAREADVDPPR